MIYLLLFTISWFETLTKTRNYRFAWVFIFENCPPITFLTCFSPPPHPSPPPPPPLFLLSLTISLPQFLSPLSLTLSPFVPSSLFLSPSFIISMNLLHVVLVKSDFINV
uniref:Uncharacterized protein n=1 Tax=Cacopsylla melanoneura TaxID=428564 RepID=A0A8D8Z8M1_9HEMI